MAFFKFALFGLLAASAYAAPQLGIHEDQDFLRAQSLGEPFDANPVYTYSFQVADDDEQTYIAKSESRDGHDVTGEYSYVDPNGSLVTVTYRSGADGYTEERNVQENFVVVRSRPSVARTATVASTSSNNNAANFGSRRTVTTSSNSNSNSGLIGNIVSQVRPAVQRVVTETSTSGSNDQDLVAQILAQLTPFIRQTVSNSLTGSNQRSTTTTTTRRVQAAPAPVVRRVVSTQSVPAVTQTSTSSVQGIFGTGGANNIRFENPDINYSFDL